MVRIKDYDFKQITIRDSHTRRALQYKNRIMNAFKVFGLTEDHIEIPMERMGMKKAQASISWYMWGEHLFFSYNKAGSFANNIAMVAQVIEHFLALVIEEKISQEQFIEEFVEDSDILEQRKNAREVLGVEEDSTDFEKMHQNYKKLAVEHHPDKPNGSTEKFKEINKAHKILKKEFI